MAHCLKPYSCYPQFSLIAVALSHTSAVKTRCYTSKHLPWWAAKRCHAKSYSVRPNCCSGCRAMGGYQATAEFPNTRNNRNVGDLEPHLTTDTAIATVGTQQPRSSETRLFVPLTDSRYCYDLTSRNSFVSPNITATPCCHGCRICRTVQTATGKHKKQNP